MKTQDLELDKGLLSLPGETIQETIDAIGMSQAELAERIGRPKEKLNDVIKGREPISTDTAFRLEKVLGIPASFWINREHEYRRELFAIEQQISLCKQHSWLKGFPILEMKKRGYLPDVKDKNILVSSLLSFFSVASPSDWKNIYVGNKVSVAFKISLSNTSSPEAISTWLRIGEIEAGKLSIAEFNRLGFKQSLPKIMNLVHDFPDDFAIQLQDICLKNGVALVFVQTLPKAPVSGASRWYRGNPLIQLSDRYKVDDQFWFSFFHEVGHILLHGKKEIFLQYVKGTNIDQKKEDEANKFAANYLLKDSDFIQIKDQEELNEKIIKEYADKFETSPGVIIGRLQREKVIEWSEGNHLKRKVDLFK